jgi:hypothetical protein
MKNESFNDVVHKMKADGVFQYAADVRRYLQVHNIHELKHIKQVWRSFFTQGNEVCINRKWCYLINCEPALQQLLKEGFVKQIRKGSSKFCRHTYLVLND